MKIRILESDFVENNKVFIIFPIILGFLLLELFFYEQYYIPLFPVFFCLVYDIHFRNKNKGEWSSYGRDTESTLAGIRAAIQYTTFMFGFIGIALSKCFEGSAADNPLLIFLNQSYWIKSYALTILFSVTLLLLFIPVSYNKFPRNPKKDKVSADPNEPSSALKNYYFTVLFLQKVVILLTVYLLLGFANFYYHNPKPAVQKHLCCSEQQIF